MNFTIDNQEHFQKNSAIHNVNPRNKDQFYRLITNFSLFQESNYYSCIRILNRLPFSLKSAMNKKAQFKVALRGYLLILLC